MDRPLPVDEEFHGPSRPTTPAGVGVQIRGHVIVDRGEGEPEYRRSPWARLRDDWVKLMMRCAVSRVAAGGTVTRSLTDDGGTSRTLGVRRPSSSAASLYNCTDAFTGAECLLKVGSDGTAPTGAENNLLAALDSWGGEYSKHITTRRAFGQKVWNAGPATLREGGLLQAYNVDGTTRPFFLVDRFTYADAPVDNGNTVSVIVDLVF